MKIGLIPFVSGIHDHQSISSAHAQLMDGLREAFDVRFISLKEVDDVDLALVFIGSGGVEGKVREACKSLPRPVILLADGLHNSLAASLEILTWLRAKGILSEVIHGSVPWMRRRIEQIFKIVQTCTKLAAATVGILGKPSDWLIASGVDPDRVEKHWGTKFQECSLKKVERLLEKTDPEEARLVAEAFIAGGMSLEGPGKDDVFQCARLYIALKAFIRKKGLSAVTVRCFDFLPKRFTGCLALSLLNNDGIVAGCEGDCQSLFSMMAGYYLTGKIPFMANPSRIDTEKNHLVLGHCTVATSATLEYSIRNHFESGLGVAVQGILPVGPVTVFKCGGRRLDRMYVGEGTLIANLNDPHFCRTQVEIAMNTPVSYFLREPIGNHHILIPGNHADLLREFMAFRHLSP